jgi:hypothetical protein
MARRTAVMALLAGAAALGAVPSAASAADWFISSSITEEFEYSDNYKLDDTEKESLWGFNTRPKIGIETHTPRTDLFFNGSLNYGYFPENTDENSFDQKGDVALRHRTERSSFGLGGTVSHDTTRTSEELDTGRDFSDANRLGLGGSASYSHTLTERVGVGIGADAGYVTYDGGTLSDYRTYSAGPFVNFVLSEQDSLQLTTTYSRYERLSGDNLESDLFVGRATWTRRLTEQFSGSLGGGANYIMTDEDVTVGGTTVTESENEIGYNASAGITYTEERGSLSAAFSHAVVPSGAGRLQRRNALNLRASYRATPVVSFGLATNFIQQEAADEDSGEDRNFVGVEPSVSWQFLPEWTARAAYRFRTQTLDEGDRVYSNGGTVSVSWRLPSWGAGQGM